MLRPFNWVWPQHSLNIVWTFFQLIDLVWSQHSINIAYKLSQQMLQESCNSLTWHSVNIINKWCDSAVFAYFRKACYPSLAERIMEPGKVVLPKKCHGFAFKRNLFGTTFTWYFFFPVERFSYDLETKTREQNRNNKKTEIERYDWFIERTQRRVGFGWLSERSCEKTSWPRTF